MSKLVQNFNAIIHASDDPEKDKARAVFLRELIEIKDLLQAQEFMRHAIMANYNATAKGEEINIGNFKKPITAASIEVMSLGSMLIIGETVDGFNTSNASFRKRAQLNRILWKGYKFCDGLETPEQKSYLGPETLGAGAGGGIVGVFAGILGYFLHDPRYWYPVKLVLGKDPALWQMAIGGAVIAGGGTMANNMLKN